MESQRVRDKINRLKRKGVDILSYLNQELIARMERIEKKEKELKKLATRLDEFEEIVKDRRLTVAEAYNKTSLQNTYWMLVKECEDDLRICKIYRSRLEFELNPDAPRKKARRKIDS